MKIQAHRLPSFTASSRPSIPPAGRRQSQRQQLSPLSRSAPPLGATRALSPLPSATSTNSTPSAASARMWRLRADWSRPCCSSLARRRTSP